MPPCEGKGCVLSAVTKLGGGVGAVEGLKAVSEAGQEEEVSGEERA